MHSQNIYDQIVTEAILNDKTFNITTVNDIERIISTFFDKNEYPLIALLIKERKWSELKSIDIHAEGFREYLDVIKFTDQNAKLYVASIYDSDELWQDPQIIDIFYLP